jgi:hypothetical protein
MQKRILLFCFITSTLHISGMKRPRTTSTTLAAPKDCFRKKPRIFSSITTSEPQSHPILFDLGSLPPELQDSIICFASKHPNAPNPKEAILLIHCLTLINLHLAQHMNCLSYNDEIIDNVAHQYHCSHETIAKYLNSPAANTRLSLQYRLMDLCFSDPKNSRTHSRLEDLLAQSCSFTFTYNYKTEQRNALMISCTHPYNIRSLFIEKGGDINAATTYGQTLLMKLATYPINYNKVYELLKDPKLDLNKQNKRGETALLCALRYRQTKHYDHLFAHLVKKLLKRGADPELPDRKGITPRKVAFGRQIRPIIDLIEEAIIKKSLTLPQNNPLCL